ncbi:MAG: flagellar filament outer layer protein FlaA [Bacteroides sp.]|nr:flagellar filament outer layer protein FlaA [Prevotella sp.]MCM1407448.1 flagellar filament outer layer protein FlaA [Treponema brennaborense]MCM1469938.1 flagellar filament outer layer protein FlaA [Bacteroides sp.]
MKQGRIICAGLLLFCVLCIPVFAQPSTKSVETIILDDFDTTNDEWSWHVLASRFVAEGYPKMGYFDGIPNSLRPLRKEGDPDPKVLGVKTSFNRKGDNWFEIVPVTDDENGEQKNHEIPLQGLVTQIDFWVWGANYVYTLDVMIRDADGRVHVLKAGTMNFSGWRNLIVNVPGHIRQQSRLRSGPESLTFVGFRVKSDPNEFVDDFVIYFDQLKYTTHTLNNIYDGYELRSVDFSENSEEAGA